MRQSGWGRRIGTFALGLALAWSAGGPAHAADFYEGKVIRLVVGFTAGGGFDVQARTLARHLSKHIPGKPAIVVENMPGAGSLKAANHIARVAKPDGLTAGMVSGATVMGQLLGRKGVQFDVRRFEVIGSPAPYKTVCVFSRKSGITSLAKWQSSPRPVKVGGTSPGASAHDVPLVLHAALGLPLQHVPGYGGTSKIRLAVEGGEVDGTCFAWDSIKATWAAKLKTGDIVAVLQTHLTKLPDLPDAPLALDLAKTDEARQLLRLGIAAPGMVNRYFTFPPKTPKDRVETLRKAFLQATKDKDFLSEAEKAKIDTDPLTAKQVMENFDSLLSMKPEVAAKLKKVFSGAK